MPHRKWQESVLLKLKRANLETGGLHGASIRVPLNGYEIARLIETLEPFEPLSLFRWHDHAILSNNKEVVAKK